MGKSDDVDTTIAAFAKKLNIGDDVVAKARKILSLCESVGMFSAKPAVGLIAAAIYAAMVDNAVETGSDMLKRMDVAKTCGISEVTLRNQYKNIRDRSYDYDPYYDGECEKCHMNKALCVCDRLFNTYDEKDLEQSVKIMDDIHAEREAKTDKFKKSVQSKYGNTVTIAGKWMLCQSCDSIFVVQTGIYCGNHPLREVKCCPFCKKTKLEESVEAMVLSDFGGN